MSWNWIWNSFKSTFQFAEAAKLCEDLNFHWKWIIFFSALEDLFNPSETSRLNLNLVKVLDKTKDEDKEQIFRLFPESRDVFTELLRVRETATWDSVKQTPFLAENFSERDAFPVDDNFAEGRRFRQLQQEGSLLESISSAL